MSSSNLIRWGGLAAMMGGVLFVIAELLDLTFFGFRYVNFFQQTLYLSGVTLLPIGLVGLYARQSEAAGLLGHVGFLVAFEGTVLAACSVWASVFITLPPAFEAPVFVLTSITFAVGWLLFGIATLLVRVYSRAAAILLIIGAVLLLFIAPLSFVGILFGVAVAWLGFVHILFDVAVAWLGFVLFTGRDTSAEQPARVS